MIGGRRNREFLNEAETMAGEQVLDPQSVHVPHASPALPVWLAHWSPRGIAKGKDTRGGSAQGDTHSNQSIYSSSGEFAGEKIRRMDRRMSSLLVI